MKSIVPLLVAITMFSSVPANAGERLVVGLVGTDTGETRKIPPTERGTKKANCFDVSLVDLKSGAVIGTASDCLADIDSHPSGGLALTGTTYFNLPGGTIVSRGRTTVQPVLDGMSPASHITGSIPHPGTNQILSGTGVYENSRGTVRLSGAVDMSRIDQNQITFDCIFVIDIH